MCYKTILVHAGSGSAAQDRMRAAALLARSCDAHLVGVAPTGLSRFLTPAVIASGGAAVASRCAAMRAGAHDALAAFARIVHAEGIASSEACLVEDEAGDALAARARYADLVVVGQAAPGQADPGTAGDLAAFLALTCGRPVLVVPHAGWTRGCGGDALVAWDGSLEASRAVAAALPLLRLARHVAVLGFGPLPPVSGQFAHPDAVLAGWLGRHGVIARPWHRPLPDDVGTALLAAAEACDAGLVVMGAYGHSRLREAMLGGVTATVLHDMCMPVLLAH